MTEPEELPFDELRERIVDAICNRIAAPDDVVPMERTERHNTISDNAGQLVRLNVGSEPILDIDGVPVGMTAPAFGYVRIPADIHDLGDTE